MYLLATWDLTSHNLRSVCPSHADGAHRFAQSSSTPSAVEIYCYDLTFLDGYTEF
jgi:hypothetical protein